MQLETKAPKAVLNSQTEAVKKKTSGVPIKTHQKVRRNAPSTGSNEEN